MFQHLRMRRAPLRRRALFAISLLLITATARAADTPGDPPAAPQSFDESASGAGARLTIDEASRLAITDQPLLSARAASIAADEALSVSAAQLPDPKLVAGLQDLPVDTHESLSVRDENFTMFTVGLSQDFPRAEKRRLNGEHKRLEAAAGRFGLDNGEREIRRDAALAWLDVYEAEQALALAHQLARESALQVRALESDYRNGRALQADWLAARVEAGLAEDRKEDWVHRSERTRAALARWIGTAAQRPLANDLAALPEPAEFPRVDATVERHPLVAGLETQIEVSEADVKLARQSYKSDFSVEGYFGYRPAYADFAGVQVSMDLPIFTANRQDQALSAALRQADAARDRKADALRELHAEAAEDYLDWHHGHARAAMFEEDIIPDALRRVEAAQSAYAAGRGSFDALLAARRSLLDTRLQALTLSVETARAQIRLRYFTAVLGGAP